MDELDVCSDRARVEEWRYEELVRAGYDPATAGELAARHDINLHQAIELLQHGCPPDTARRILL